MEIITKEQMGQLIANGKRSESARKSDKGFDPKPVVKLFTPDAQATWLLTEVDPEEPDFAFGLCDLGFGCPELGSVSLHELRSIRGQSGLPVERDRHFIADKSLSEYADEARTASGIVA